MQVGMKRFFSGAVFAGKKRGLAGFELLGLGLVAALALGGLGLELGHVRLGHHVAASHGFAVDAACSGQLANPPHRALVLLSGFPAGDELPALLVLHHCNHAPIVPIPEPRIKLSERPAFANSQPGAPRRIGTAVLPIVDVLGKV